MESFIDINTTTINTRKLVLQQSFLKFGHVDDTVM